MNIPYDINNKYLRCQESYATPGSIALFHLLGNAGNSYNRF